MNTSDSPDALLAELAAQGAAPAPKLTREGPDDYKEGPAIPKPAHPRSFLPDADDQPDDEVSAGYAEARRRIISRAGQRNWTSYTDGIKRVRYSHEDCIDRILMSPSITQLELSQIYGVTPTWMSIVCNCDAFKAKLAERREELVDPALRTSLNERYGALAARSVEVLLEKLAQSPDKISDKLALEAAALGAKATGLGEPRAPAGQPIDHLAAIAHRLLDLNRPPSVTIEGAVRRID